MKVDVKIRYGLDQILKEMGSEAAGDIMVLKAEDRFFVGYGCEYSEYHDLPLDLRANKQYLRKVAQNSSGNISVCKCR
jgi:hypothetical protein